MYWKQNHMKTGFNNLTEQTGTENILCDQQMPVWRQEFQVIYSDWSELLLLLLGQGDTAWALWS